MHTIHAYCVTKFLLHLIQLMTHSSHGVRDQEGTQRAHQILFAQMTSLFLQLLQIAPIHLSPPLEVHMLAYFLQTLRCNFSFTLLHDLDKLFGKAPMDGSPKGSRTGVQKCNTSSILKKMVLLQEKYFKYERIIKGRCEVKRLQKCVHYERSGRQG